MPTDEEKQIMIDALLSDDALVNKVADAMKEYVSGPDIMYGVHKECAIKALTTMAESYWQMAADMRAMAATVALEKAERSEEMANKYPTDHRAHIMFSDRYFVSKEIAVIIQTLPIIKSKVKP